MWHRRHLVYFKAECVAGTAVPVRNNAKATLKQTGKDGDWTSPESEFGWVLGTTGSVLVSALSRHGRSHLHPQLGLHPWSRLEPARGPLLSDTSDDVLALMLSPRKKIQWSKTKADIFETHFLILRASRMAKRSTAELTCPQTSSANPTNRHQSHCSTFKGEQLKGFPPNCTITIYKSQTEI